MKKILVPTDFSDYAMQAIRTAVQWAAKSGAEIILMNNVDVIINWSTLSNKEKQNHPEILQKTNQVIIKLERLMKSNLFKNVKVSMVVTHGVTYELIVSTAEKLGVDLVVMGSHGNEGSGKYFIGSTAQKVMRESRCPVLSVKKDAQIRRWKNVLFPANFDEDLHSSFEHVKKLASAFGATIHLVYVNTPGHFKDTTTAHKQMDDFAARYKGMKFQSAIFNHFDMESGILDHADGIKADWIAMATHNRKRVPKYNIGVTETVAYRSDKPVLSVCIPSR